MIIKDYWSLNETFEYSVFITLQAFLKGDFDIMNDSDISITKIFQYKHFSKV